MFRGVFRNTDCCFLLFDTCSQSSFDNVIMWKEKFEKESTAPNIDTFPFVLIGTKSDKSDQREVLL